MKTIAERIKANGITMKADRTDSNPSMEDFNGDHWKCVLKMGGKRMTVVFSMGYGHNGKAPKAADVLDCLCNDATGLDNSSGFEDWCSEYGYETDSRKAERTYKTIERQAKRLKHFLGESFEDFAYKTERL
jgi:hypothetical protein